MNANDIKAKIFSADDMQIEDITIEEWGGVKLYVKSMSGLEKADFEMNSLLKDGSGNTEMDIRNFRARLITCTTFADAEATSPVFTEDDIQDLGKKNVAILDRIVAIAQRLNGISKADEEDMVKNSQKVQEEGTT